MKMGAGLKLVELQVALPRTQTAGKMQEQIQQRSAVAQDHLSQQQIEQDIKKKKTTTETENLEQKRLANDDESKKNNARENGTHKDKKSEVSGEKKEAHPYKGKHIDITW